MKRNNGQEHFISQKKILEVFDGASGKQTTHSETHPHPAPRQVLAHWIFSARSVAVVQGCLEYAFVT
jgi:hypothetical protein